MHHIFRIATLEDEETLFPLVLASQLFQKKELEQKQIDEDVFATQNRALLEQWIEEEDKGYVIVEDEGKNILGFALCMIDNPIAHDGSITDLYVVPEARSNHIGRSLIVEALAWLKKHGVENVTLAVHKNNIPALALYTNAGFVEKDDPYTLMGKRV